MLIFKNSIMKTLKFVIVAIILVFIGQSVEAKETKKDKAKGNIQEVVFDVSMDCHGCQTKIEKNISWEKGVKDLKVDLEKKTVTIKYDKRKTDEEKLKEAIAKLNFTCTIKQ